VAATRDYGAEVTLVNTIAERFSETERIARETGAMIIPPYDDLNIILGQGTCAWEFLQQMSEQNVALDAVVIPVGGGGLLAGSLLACVGSGVKVFAAEPAMADDCFRGVKEGLKATAEATPKTIADGLLTEVGELNFQIIKELVAGVFTVSEQEIAVAMKLVLERLKVVIEPSAAVAVAVVIFNADFKRTIQDQNIQNIGIILEGGNVDTGSYEKMMPWLHLQN
jgi:threonine dehydratase